jgi:hypothetical protein
MCCSPEAEAPATPPSNKTQSTGSCVPARGRGPEPAQDRCAAPHGRLRVPPGPRPRRRPPRRRSPSRHVPCQQQQAGGNEEIEDDRPFGALTNLCVFRLFSTKPQPTSATCDGPGQLHYWVCGNPSTESLAPNHSWSPTTHLLDGLSC